MNNKIFISIASYRDDACANTIFSAFSQAKYPEQVFMGVCQQNAPQDPDCIDMVKHSPYLDNIRIVRLDYNKAKGPTYARYICSKLHKDEEYFFQIDSHTEFMKNWDKKLIDMLMQIPDSKAVLSHYPPENGNIPELTTAVPVVKSCHINEDGLISLSQAIITDTQGQFIRTPFITGNMFFCRSNFLKELPYSPNLDFLFMGEEILNSVRFFTNGWNSYTPNQNVVFHEYTREGKPKFWTDLNYDNSRTINKVKYILGLGGEATPDAIEEAKNYGLGKNRSLTEFYDYIKAYQHSPYLVKENFSLLSKNKKSEPIFKYLIILLIVLVITLIIFLQRFRI